MGHHGYSRARLYLGRPTGSAAPLVWAHAEYIKLRRSLRDGFVFDMPSQTCTRYLGAEISSNVFKSRRRLVKQRAAQGGKS